MQKRNFDSPRYYYQLKGAMSPAYCLLEMADAKVEFEHFGSMEAWQAKQLDKAERERCPKRKALCTGQSHLFRAQALERKRELHLQKTAGIVCQPGSDDGYEVR